VGTAFLFSCLHVGRSVSGGGRVVEARDPNVKKVAPPTAQQVEMESKRAADAAAKRQQERLELRNKEKAEAATNAFGSFQRNVAKEYKTPVKLKFGHAVGNDSGAVSNAFAGGLSESETRGHSRNASTASDAYDSADGGGRDGSDNDGGFDSDSDNGKGNGNGHRRTRSSGNSSKHSSKQGHGSVPRPKGKWGGKATALTALRNPNGIRQSANGEYLEDDGAGLRCTLPMAVHVSSLLLLASSFLLTPCRVSTALPSGCR
jgi:hypothetical protein